MLYKRYQDARDAAWRTLLRFETGTLPVDVEKIALGFGITPEKWPDEKETPRLYALLPNHAAAASLRISGVWHIFMQPGLSYSRYRFALAHELGHIILQHKTIRLDSAVYTFEGRENAGDILAEPLTDADQDADMFAIRLLAPACVLHGLHVQGKWNIGALCGLPENAAAMRAERMALLDRRNAYHVHPLEKQVRILFSPFIREKAREALPQKPSAAPSLPLAPQQKETAPPKRSFPLWAALLLCGAVLAALLILPKLY